MNIIDSNEQYFNQSFNKQILLSLAISGTEFEECEFNDCDFSSAILHDVILLIVHLIAVI
jgi:fluoroquinolone resistance protein